jgi:hypothetical protein
MAFLGTPPPGDGSPRPPTGLSEKQDAEIQRFDRGDYDVVLGMLERRIDGIAASSSTVRHQLGKLLREVKSPGGPPVPPKASALHRALIRLANRGVATTIATTNFDRLLQAASSSPLLTHSLGGIPRPGRSADFAGVLHIHGVLHGNAALASDLVVTDRDFGEFYLRRRVVPDFVYDAARLFHLVLVGYSANDAPMRYLLNAVAADGSRFDDLKERFAFVATPTGRDPSLEDWRGRGITPVPYDPTAGHAQLASTVQRWAELAPTSGSPRKLSALIRKLVKLPRAKSSDADRDLFDHIVRRASSPERARYAELIAGLGASTDWLSAMTTISREQHGRS